MLTLTQRQMDDFYDVGYFVVENLFSSTEVAALGDYFDRLQAKAERLSQTKMIGGTRFVVEKGRIHRIVWCPGYLPEIDTFAQDPRLCKPAAQLLGSNEILQLISQAHYKLPGDRVSFPLHQDTENRGYGTLDWVDVNGRGSYVQTLMAIDPMTSQNSPLQVVPGSSRLGHLDLDKGNRREELLKEVKLETLTLTPGSVIFFHPYLIHGSGENHSVNPRRVFINGFAFPGSNRRIYPGAGKGRLIQVYNDPV